MTTKNPFEKFWKKWDIYHRHGKVEGYCLVPKEWVDFKQEFFSLCEKQAKKAEKEQGKGFEVKKGGGYRNLFDSYFQNGMKEAFRLVQGTAQNDNQNEKILVLHGKSNRAKLLVQGGKQENRNRKVSK